MYRTNIHYGGLGVLGMTMIIYGLMSMAVLILTLVSVWRIFKKAGKPGWAAIVPIYNIIVLLEVCDLPLWYIVLFFIPIANIYAVFKTYITLAEKFGKTVLFGVLTVFFPYVCLPILAFSKDSIVGGSTGSTHDGSGHSTTSSSTIASSATTAKITDADIDAFVAKEEPKKAEKKPMDPKNKKMLIIGCSVAGGVLLLIIIITTIVATLSGIDYSASYRAAVALKERMKTIYYDSSCSNVEIYVNSAYISEKSYEKDIASCKQLFDGMDELVFNLGNSDIVKKNNSINDQFAKFKGYYDEATSNGGDLEKNLAVYSAWHKFSAAVDDLSYTNSSDAAFTKAANILIESGNDTLKKYGEGWLEKSLAVASAYRTYNNSSYSDPKHSSYYSDYRNALSAIKTYSSENKPDIKEEFPIEKGDVSKMYSAFSGLYSDIVEIYEKNYNAASGDCTVRSSGMVFCD